VAGTFDGVNIKLYLDGVQVDGATSTIQDIYYFGTGNLYIGAYTDSSYLAFSGMIDEVRIWGSALTASQLDDMTPPVINITTPDNGATYLLNQTVNADWSVSDGTGTGVAIESGTVPSGSPISTAVAGTHIFTVTATDYAKNTDTKTVTYSVVLAFSGILPPIKPDGTSVFKLGSTVPVKFQLRDAQDNFVTDAVATISLQKLVGGEPYGSPVDGGSTSAATTGNLFRYDPTSDQYIFNLATKVLSTGTWEITITVNGTGSYSVEIGLK
jgi:hypothetical protein